MADINDRKWRSDAFRIHAKLEDEKIERRIAEADGAIRQLRVFKDPALNERLIEEADASGREGRLPDGVLDKLRTDPKAIGPLRGSLLDKREARHSAKEMAARLEARAGMRSTQAKYDKLWHQANAVERLTKEEEAERLEGLRDERAFCDAARDSRDLEFRDAMEGLRKEEPSPDDQDEPWSRRR